MRKFLTLIFIITSFFQINSQNKLSLPDGREAFLPNQWEEFVIPFNDVLISDKNFITFWIDGGDHTETTIVYIDDIKVESIQTCPKPSMLRVEKNNSDSIVLNWFSKMSSNWEIWALTEPMTDFTSNSDGFRTTIIISFCIIP